MKARKKKIVYRAYKFWGKHLTPEFIQYVSRMSKEPISFDVHTKTLTIHKEMPMYLTAGNWIIENPLPNGKCEYWVVEMNIFRKTYNRVGNGLYCKKPVTVDYFRFERLDAQNIRDAYAFLGVRASNDMINASMRDRIVHLTSLEGAEVCKLGDVIIKGVSGEYYCMPFATFNNLYEKIGN